MSIMSDVLTKILELFAAYSFNFSNEKELQDGIEQMFAAEGIVAVREASLNKADRIDFLVGDIGIEVKVGHSFTDVIRQLHRYAQVDAIQTLVLVTTRLQHQMPDDINGKALITINLALSHSL